MGRTAIWKSIADTLIGDIAEGRYRAGDKLPTEAELSQRFGVNRHTVRRALAEMAESGLVHARRGAGVFVSASPTDYPLGRRVRFSQNLKAAGRTPDRQVLLLETRPCDAREAEALALPPGAPVHAYESLSFADGGPLGLARAVFPANRLPNMIANLRAQPSITEALRRDGVVDYTRASTRLAAKLATATQALHLHIREGAPILRAISINIDDTGRPVEYGHTWFAGDKISLIVTPD